MTRIAITGTPGCGKTTLAKLLGKRMPVFDVGAMAKEHGLVAGRDDADDADVIDIDGLARRVQALPADCAIDGHLAHLLPVDVIWVIRCHPDVIQERLQERGYMPAKVAENVEAEAMDLILQEALAAGPPVIQRDGTRRSPSKLLSAFEEAGPAPLNTPDIEGVDWSDVLLR